MANKPPTLTALFRHPTFRKLLLAAAGICVLYVILNSLSGNDTNDVKEVLTGEKYVRQCIAKLSGSHNDNTQKTNKVAGSCPLEPPKEMVDAYTMGGRIPIADQWKCQTGPEYDKAHAYTKEDIDEKVARVKQRLTNYYGETDRWLYNAMDQYSIKDKHVVIMGSQRPVYEAVCLVFGGSHCTTIDFQPIIIPKYDRFTTMTLDQYDEHPQAFDAAISISSFEHDGLGRYGDPLRPTGDLDMMKKMKCILKPDGILYLSVPIAMDKVVWNMHRIYGQLRLPMLLEEWKLLDIFADHRMYNRWSGCDCYKEGDYEPVLVLQNTKPKEGENLAILNRYLLQDFKVGTSCYV